MESEDTLPYGGLIFPEAPKDRPYVFINMVTTIDGKILSGERDEPVSDLGSATDHALMRRIEHAAQAVIIGAGSLRATKGLWYPKQLLRVVVSASGHIPIDGRFFADAPDRAFVCTDTDLQLPAGVRRLPLDLKETLQRLRLEFGVERLLCEGGAELNASLLRQNLVDELFLTLAPKIKLGRNVPTYADGEPLSRADILNFSIVEMHRIGEEVFLRYRRQTAA